MLNRMMVFALIFMAAACVCATKAARSDTRGVNERTEACVILLHGLCRSPRSMLKIKHCLEAAGYKVINLDYDSTHRLVEEIAATEMTRAVDQCRQQGLRKIHVVTHSLGALVVRAYLQNNSLPAHSRVVMLAPPNQGSELANTALAHLPTLYTLGGGPAAGQLATHSPLINGRLRPVAAEIGIIAGDLSFNPVFSRLLPGKDDGKVAVRRTRLPEMRDFITVPANHTLILWNKTVNRQILHFLASGSFKNSMFKKSIR